jgi:hypothetical protein
MQNITLRFAQFSIVGDLLLISVYCINPVGAQGLAPLQNAVFQPILGLPDTSLNEWVHERSQALCHRERLPLPVRHGSFQVYPP